MTELDRILSLPERRQTNHPRLPEELRGWEDHLWPIQVEALALLATQPKPLGLYADVGVGGGKFLIATLAGTVVKAKRPLVMTRLDLIEQAKYELERFLPLFPELADHMPRYVAYSTLSRPGSTDLLDEIKPDLIALDEAHAVASRTSARGIRLRRYVVENPGTRILVLSGTLNRKTLLDVYDLAELALRETAWLPLARGVQDAWASMLDHDAKPAREDLEKYLSPLLNWAGARDVDVSRRDEKETYQAALRARYVSCPGVIASRETEVGCSIHLRMLRPEPPEEISTAVRHLADTWELPDGTEIVEALDYWRHAATLSLGFYYKPLYVGDESLVELWLERRRNWSKAVRRQIVYIKAPGVDSPANVVEACESGRAHPDVVRAYIDWSEVRDAIRVDKETIWLTKDLVNQAIDRVLKTRRSILWYESKAIEAVLRERGVKVFGAGSSAPRPNVTHPALSRHVHGTGKNLQAWSSQLVLEPPSSATAWEQMLGRTHRPGQLDDEVVADIFAPTWVARAKVHAATEEADFVARTSNKRHKLNFCTWSIASME